LRRGSASRGKKNSGDLYGVDVVEAVYFAPRVETEKRTNDAQEYAQELVGGGTRK